MKNQPVFKTALLFCTGIVLGRWVTFSIPVPYVALLVSVLVLYRFFSGRKHPNAVQAMIALVLLVSGAVRYKQENALVPQNHVVHLVRNTNDLQIKVFLVRDPVQKIGKVELLAETEAVMLPDSVFAVSGKVLVTFYDTTACLLQYGDEVLIRGRLERPSGKRNPGGFDYRAYLGRKGVYVLLKPVGTIQAMEQTGNRKGNALMREAVYPVRRFILQTVDRTAGPVTRSVLKALLVGDQGSIPDDVREGFSKSGAVHILSVSGSHVGFVLLILITVFGLFRLPPGIRTLFVILGLVFYCLLAEANAPVVRATLMAVVYSIGVLFERKPDPYNVIGVAMWVDLAVVPQDLFDLSFQLSFASVLSIVFFYRKLKNLSIVQKMEIRFSKRAWGRYLISAVLVSVAAQIGTFPVIAVYFNQIPVLSIFANLVAVPLSGLIVALGFTTFLLAPLSFEMASAYGLLNRQVLWIFTRFIVWIGNLPFSHVVVPSPNGFQIAMYFAAVLFIVFFHDSRWRKRAVWIFLLSANVWIWKTVLSHEFRTLTWIQLDVGQGDAAVFRFPRGKCMLVDGGSKTPYWNAGESVIAPYLRKNGIRNIDLVVLTHPHDDHVGGLITILEQFSIGAIAVTGDTIHSPVYAEFRDVLLKRKLHVQTILAPDSVNCFPGVKLYFLSPAKSEMTDQTNERSLVLRILYGKSKWLLMGDAGQPVETLLISSGIRLDADVVKIGHHGSNSSSSEAFIRKIRPACAVVSVGKNNRFGHPSASVLGNLERNGVSIFRTDRSGAIVFKTDGEKTQRMKWKDSEYP